MDLFSIGSALASFGFKKIGNLVSGGSKKVLKTVTDTLKCEPEQIIDNLVGNKENIKLLEIEEKKINVDLKKLNNEDKKNIRDYFLSLQSTSASWLMKNIPALIAIWVLLLVTIDVVMSKVLNIDPNRDINMLVMVVVTFYFGSSNKGE